MKKRYIIAGIVVIAAAVAGYYYYINQNKAVSANMYQTHKVLKGDVSLSVSATGNIGVKDMVSLYLESSQLVSKVHVKEGDKVKKGDVLVEYDISKEMSDLERKLAEAKIQLENAELSLRSIEQSAVGNELVQYQSDVTTAEKSVSDAEEDLLAAEKSITDANGDIDSINIKIRQQQMFVDDALDQLEKYEKLLSGGGIPQKLYDDALISSKSLQGTLDDLLLQKEMKEKLLETKTAQVEYAKRRLETRLEQVEYAKVKLENSQNKLMDESVKIQYQLQKNAVLLNAIKVEQIEADMAKLTEKSLSPIDGNVVSIQAKDGGTVTKSVAVVTLSDTAGIIAKLDLSEYDAPAVEVGQKANITTSAIPDKIYSGTVSKIAEEALEKEDSSNNEVIVPLEITIDGIDSKLRIGYSVDIEILIEEAANVINVPVKALQQEDGMYYVYVVQIDGGLEKRDVSIGLYGDKTVEIISGINDGEVVLLNPEILA